MGLDHDRHLFYDRILALAGERYSLLEIALELNVPPAQVIRAVRLRLTDHFGLTASSRPARLKAAIREREARFRKINDTASPTEEQKARDLEAEIIELEKLYLLMAKDGAKRKQGDLGSGAIQMEFAFG